MAYIYIKAYTYIYIYVSLVLIYRFKRLLFFKLLYIWLFWAKLY